MKNRKGTLTSRQQGFLDLLAKQHFNFKMTYSNTNITKSNVRQWLNSSYAFGRALEDKGNQYFHHLLSQCFDKRIN